MRVIQRGHVYELANKNKGFQILTFIKDLPEGAVDNHDGCLRQEAIRALIDSYLDLFAQVPCPETMRIIEHLRAAFVEGETRAARRSLEKSYSKTGLHVEQLPVMSNGHIFKLESQQ